jgi:hypothetical protein
MLLHRADDLHADRKVIKMREARPVISCKASLLPGYAYQSESSRKMQAKLANAALRKEKFLCRKLELAL